MRVTRATHGQVLVVQKELGSFVRRSQRGFTPEEKELAQKDMLPLDQGVNGKAYISCQAVRVDDIRAEPDYFPLIPSTRTELAVPIIRDGQVLGNLDLQSPEVGAFRDADLGYLTALADQVAIAIRNARLYHTAQQEIKERTRAEQTQKRYAAQLPPIICRNRCEKFRLSAVGCGPSTVRISTLRDMNIWPVCRMRQAGCRL
jgi:GAF domain-containing protein